MDQTRFADLTRSLTRVPSRRDVLRGLAGAGLGLATARLPALAAAKKRKNMKSKPKSAKPNAFGCLNVGAACRNAEECCSGVCEAKKCRAHHAGICKANSDLCTTGVGHVCGIVSDDGPICACVLTTGNAPFCAEAGASCRDCSTDNDCEQEFGPGAACVVLKVVCEGSCPDTGDTACMRPCADPATRRDASALHQGGEVSFRAFIAE